MFEAETSADFSKTPPLSTDAANSWTPSDQPEWRRILPFHVRCLAPTEFQELEEIQKFKIFIGIGMGHGTGRFTDTIIPAFASNFDAKTFGNKVVDPETQRSFKLPGRGIGRILKDMRCEILEGRRCTEHRHHELYWRSLEVLVRKHATKIGNCEIGGVNNRRTKVECFHRNNVQLGVDREFFRTIEDIDEDSEQPGVVFPCITREDTVYGGCQVLLRRQPYFDPRTKQLHVNLDIGACLWMRGNTLLQTMYSIFGGPDDKYIRVWNEDCYLCRFLRGLRVHCAYLPPNLDDIEAGRKETLIPAPQRIEGRVFQIKFVAWPQDIPDFEIEPVWGAISVNDYFDECESLSLVPLMLAMY